MYLSSIDREHRFNQYYGTMQAKYRRTNDVRNKRNPDNQMQQLVWRRICSDLLEGFNRNHHHSAKRMVYNPKIVYGNC